MLLIDWVWLFSLEYEMELGQSHDQLEDDDDDEPPSKKMRYGDAELDEGPDDPRTGISNVGLQVDGQSKDPW